MKQKMIIPYSIRNYVGQFGCGFIPDDEHFFNDEDKENFPLYKKTLESIFEEYPWLRDLKEPTNFLCPTGEFVVRRMIHLCDDLHLPVNNPELRPLRNATPRQKQLILEKIDREIFSAEINYGFKYEIIAVKKAIEQEVYDFPFLHHPKYYMIIKDAIKEAKREERETKAKTPRFFPEYGWAVPSKAPKKEEERSTLENTAKKLKPVSAAKTFYESVKAGLPKQLDGKPLSEVQQEALADIITRFKNLELD